MHQVPEWVSLHIHQNKRSVELSRIAGSVILIIKASVLNIDILQVER